MDRNREARRTTMAANGLSRRRHRSNSLRDSPDEDGPVELQEPGRLRDRGTGKKDRDRERDRDRDRDRSSRSKRRRGDRLIHGSNRDDGGEDSSEESVNDEEDEDDDVGGGLVRMLPLNPSSLSSTSLSNHRKSFPQAKDFRAAPTWKAADEMIGVSVPRKARSASTKRLHEYWASNGGIMGEQFHRQASTSPVRTSVAAMGLGPSLSPASPSSSNASVRKKIKPSGPKLRPPKSSSKSSSAQDEIEIEIAEVLYGMRQPQGISKQETLANDLLKFDSRETNKSSGDGKSSVSSPISNTQSAAPLPLPVPPQNSSTSIALLSAVAPKRKRPRPVKYEDENPTNLAVRSSPISSTTKAESDQPSKVETCSPDFNKKAVSTTENGSVSYDLANTQVVQASSEPQSESIKLESNMSSESMLVTEESERQDVGLSKEEPHSPKKESSVPKLDDEREDVKATKANPAMSESGNQREEKFQIDLMAPPPPSRSSPERDVDIDFVTGDPKPMAVEAEMEAKPMVKEDDKSPKMNKEEAVPVETEKKRETEETDIQKPLNVQKERSIDLQIDLEKTDKDSVNGNMVGKRHQQSVPRPPQPPNSEKAVHSSAVPVPISVPSWPGSLPPMGYMTPLQGVVSMDGTAVSSAAIPPPHLLFNQPRPKRCATHCYIARTISYNQQIARMNPFWPAAAAGSASLYGAKPCNLNVVPSNELQGNIVSRAANSAQDKGHSLTMFPGHIGKEKGSQTANMETAQRKQMLLQQALPAGAPSNILHGPTFIFPLNQQQAAAAATVRPGSIKSLPTTATGNGVSSSCTSNAVPASASATGATAAPTMSFSYPNMTGNETQYLAILQNNAYPFPIPAHVGGPPAYRGSHAQALPFFNGSFYSSQMLHPSQLQQPQLPAQSQQNQQGHHNSSMSSGSSSSQKHLQNHQQKPNASGASGGRNLQGFPASSKNQPSQPLHMPNHHASHPSRHIESEMCGDDSPSSADSRLSRATMSIYGHNFAMPMQPPNFAMMTPTAVGGAVAATGANGSHSEKKSQQQQASTKAGVEASQAFAMSFATINGATTATGLDLSSIAQNHPIMQSHNFQMMAAQAAQQKKNFRVSEEGKCGGDSLNPDEDRKGVAGKVPATVGQSIAFSRPDVSDPSVSAMCGNTVLDSSARTINLGSASARATAAVMPASINNSAASSQQQVQRNQQQQHQLIQVQKPHQFAAAAVRSKTPSTSNGSAYSDHLPSATSMATKFANAGCAYPQNLAQSSSTAAQSPQWKSSVRPTTTTTSQSPSPTMTSTPSSVKTVSQQQARSQQVHTQISFSSNPKSSTATQVQTAASAHSPSPPVMVGSPTTSSMSKSAGSPKTTSTGNKTGQASSLSSQQPKSSQAVPSRKSSPVGGRNVPSILSGPQLTTSSSTGVKPQLPQHQQPQLISKQSLQQAQLFFSNAYMHPQASQSNSSTSTTSAASAYYLQRRGPDPHMQRQSPSGTSSNGMLSLCPAATIVSTSSTDSSKVTAAASNIKGGGLPTQGFMHPAFAAVQPSGNHHQFIHAGFPYAVPAAVQVKPAEQKQPAGE
ncbi:protein TIME FOR COFFEE isoform X2 [Senna tora]|uniref:Protein TIME FOR COFFEE isoform X2 n=1 Tax=Senna tora TaxID=362788 RepID=A0A834X2X6_9FABA|nr:protein TIME FOR COFFEE isoform X2 [Senna tora]